MDKRPVAREQRLLVAVISVMAVLLGVSAAGQSRAAGGATFSFVALAPGQHIAFDPATDVLNVDAPGANAGAVIVTAADTATGVGLGGKTVWLDGTRVGQISLANVTFPDGSRLVMGDTAVGTGNDDLGQTYPFLADDTVGQQVWGLGGADRVNSGSGADKLVGNGPQGALVHVSRVGSQGAPTATNGPTVSADGLRVGFNGGWTGFGSSSNISTDVLVKNLRTGIVSNEHRDGIGVLGLSGSGSSQISADGRSLVFSSSSGLVPGPPPSGTIFVADVNGPGIQAASTTAGSEFLANSADPDISADGRYVVFATRADNGAPGATSAFADAYLKDLQTGVLTRLSTGVGGGDANADCTHPRISADGRFVVFASAATNLTSGNTGNSKSDVFLWDRQSPGSLANITGAAAGSFDSLDPDVASFGDGSVIVFESGKRLVAADTNTTTDVYSRSVGPGAFRLVSATAAGAAVGSGASEDPAVSGDGRFVAFRSFGDSLVPGDNNGVADVFVKDRTTGSVALVSRTPGVLGNDSSGAPEISLGGDVVVFESAASNLAATDGNGTATDVFSVSNPLLRDTLAGGAGGDTYVLNRPDTVVEQPKRGTDTVQSSFSYTLGADLENLVLTGGATSGTGNALANTITGTGGPNTLNGAGGTDTVSYASAGSRVTVNLATVGPQATGGAGMDSLVSMENVLGSAFNDDVIGTAGANRLDGGPGNDTLRGGAGNDTYVTDSAADIASGTGESGTDTVVSAVNWTLSSFLENLTLTGTAVNGGGNGSANVITGNGIGNTLAGGNGDDSLRGLGGNDVVNGAWGDDLVDGGPGNDTLHGGAGNDTYVTDSAADITSGTGESGTDTVVSAVNWTLSSFLENLTLTGTAVNGGGNAAANVITGNGIGNTLKGAGGDDVVRGGAGADVLSGGAGSDTIAGGPGADQVGLDSTLGSDRVGDFVPGTDDVRIGISALPIGDRDLVVDGPAVRAAPGGFPVAAELVVFTRNLASLSPAAAAAAIGSATGSYPAGALRLFVVDDGADTGVYLFRASSAGSAVTAGELTLLATLAGTPATSLGDYLFAA